jgi:hypothetical protein
MVKPEWAFLLGEIFPVAKNSIMITSNFLKLFFNVNWFLSKMIYLLVLTRISSTVVLGSNSCDSFTECFTTDKIGLCWKIL